jgi:hypothetical protein
MADRTGGAPPEKGDNPSEKAGPADDPPTSPASASPASKPSRGRWWNPKLWSGPRWAASTVAVAVVAAAATYYMPGVFRSVSNPVSPITTTVVDNSTPPITMVVPAGRTAVGNPGPACSTFRSWGLSDGGVDAGDTEFSLLVQGTSSNSVVVVLGMRAQVVSRAAPLGGTVVSCPTAGEVASVPVKIDLDSSGQGQLVTSAPGTPFDRTVSSIDPENFDIGATASDAFYKWDLVVVASVAGQTKTFVVTDHGQPFETTPVPQGVTNYSWNYSNGWQPIAKAPGAPAQIPVGTTLPATA